MAQRIRSLRALGAACTASLLLAGCGGGEHPSADQARTASQKVPAISPLERQQFAEDLTTAVDDGDLNTVNELIDWPAVMAAATSGIDAPEDTISAFGKTVQFGSGNAPGYADQMAAAVAGGAHYTLLHTSDQGPTRAMFRMLLPGGGVAYQEYALARSSDGKVRANDVFIVAAGEKLSQLLRRAFIATIEHDSQGLLQRLTRSESAYAANMPKMQEMVDCMQRGDNRQALAVYRSMPEEVRNEKSILIQRLRAAQGVSDAEFTEATADINRLFGNDPAMSLLLLDGYVVKKQYDKALQCIDQLDRLVGGDPYLNAMRAKLYVEKGDLPEARRRAQLALTNAPQLADSYWAAASVALAEKQFDEVPIILDAIASRFQVSLDDLPQRPQFAEFVKSPQYAAWMAGTGVQVAPANPPAEPAAPKSDPPAAKAPKGKSPKGKGAKSKPQDKAS